MPRPSIHSDLREVREDLATARDEQIARVVAMVDAMTHRGEADALIAPLRARLAVLRPSRPFNFTRLLFTPLDPLIVLPSKWRRGGEGVPRSALTTLAALVRAAMPAESERLDGELSRRIGPRLADSAAGAMDLGAALWPAAARILAKAAVPWDWTARTGVAVDDFAPITCVAATVLGSAVERYRLAAQIRCTGEADARQMSRLVADTLKAPAQVAAPAIGALLADMPRPDTVLAAADALGSAVGGRIGAVTECGIDIALARLQETTAASAASAPGSDDLHNAVCLLQALERRQAPRPERRALLRDVRTIVDAACRKNFVDTVTTDLLDPLEHLGDAVTDREAVALENTARTLRRLEATGRQLGNHEFYAAMLQRVLNVVAKSKFLTLADRVRLTEVLANSDVALALLERG